MKKGKPKIERFCFEKCEKPEKVFHWKQDPPVNQNQTRGHNVCQAAIKQLMRSRTPSATIGKKKGGG